MVIDCCIFIHFVRLQGILTDYHANFSDLANIGMERYFQVFAFFYTRRSSKEDFLLKLVQSIFIVIWLDYGSIDELNYDNFNNKSLKLNRFLEYFTWIATKTQKTYLNTISHSVGIKVVGYYYVTST